MNNPEVTTSLGLTYEQTEPQRRLLSWQRVTQFGGKGSYQGTADQKKIAQRRAKNKVAAKSRRANRG